MMVFILCTLLVFLLSAVSADVSTRGEGVALFKQGCGDLQKATRQVLCPVVATLRPVARHHWTDHTVHRSTLFFSFACGRGHRPCGQGHAVWGDIASVCNDHCFFWWCWWGWCKDAKNPDGHSFDKAFPQLDARPTLALGTLVSSHSTWEERCITGLKQDALHQSCEDQLSMN